GNFAQREQSADVSITINGETLQTDTPPTIENNRTLAPMRAIFEALGCTIEWDDETKTVTAAADDGTVITLTIGEMFAMKNGEVLELDCAAKIENGRTVVPVRFIAEALSCTVNWNNDARCVEIEK
ncbi:MAG: copper amine oxidase N-terminal domain-containing protein, partial [Clostridia bacterium]|nr:copper amine oxidase N-terminal domain-containing protein [Clostridia bacterium]